jgi:iron complex transport system ATP-binding protein
VLSAEAITVERGGRRLVDGVSLALAPGEVLGVVGPNGAGKTTLLRVMAGLETPQTGRVRLDGTDLARIDRQSRARRIAYLPQSGAAEGAVTVRQLVALGRLPHGGGNSPADGEAIDRALAMMDLGALADRVATTLSGGELARALFARALAVEAGYLIADEPAMALDPRHQLELLGCLRGLAGRGVGVLLVLHDLTQALWTCDRLAVLVGGRVAAEGAPEQALAPANLASAYGVTAIHGRQGDVGFIVPWRIDPGAA